jgi:hypothetical protein
MNIIEWVFWYVLSRMRSAAACSGSAAVAWLWRCGGTVVAMRWHCDIDA